VKKNKNAKMKSKKIIVIGHSMGGMVIRTAILLNNHPNCVVNLIILLSSPVLKLFFLYIYYYFLFVF
jgi:triacylglycerol esterase/lipase EstA (alpha/beta hydrolase family)